MNTYQNKEAKKYLVGMAVCSFMAILVFVFVMCALTWRWKATENKAILHMLEIVYEKYPEADLSELTQALNHATLNNTKSNHAAFHDSSFYDKGEEDEGGYSGKGTGEADIERELEKYGIDNSIYYIKEMQAVHRLAIYAGVGLFLIAEIMMVSLFVFYLKKRQKELFLLENYMERISEGDYNLDLSDNSEDELSSLKNHLYKLTIMLKEQARIAKERKTALAESVSDISHQLKTPLTSAQILLDNITENPNMDEETKQKFIKEISNQVNGMRWMIVSMLKLSRLDAGVVEFEKKKISLDKLIREAVDNLEVIMELKGVQVEYCAKEKEIMIVGDYNWNREALQNILKNAIEHSDSNEKVMIHLQQNDVYTSITVINKGRELTPKQQKQIFERYYSEGKFEENSIGIGLPLAKAILERQGGYIVVESKDGTNSFIIKYILSR